MELITEIGVFTRVVELRSFTRAAAELGMTPSGVSRAVARLEERLGLRLLRRTTRQVSPTDDGAVYFAQCSRILADLDEANLEMARKRCDDAPGCARGARSLDAYAGRSTTAQYSAATLAFGRTASASARCSAMRTHCGLSAGLDMGPGVTHLAQLNKVPQHVLGRTDTRGGLGLIQVFEYWARDQLREGTLVETLTDFEPEPRVVSALFARNRHEVPRVKVFIDFVARLFH
jgi:DNA-binding transcriptional LysR family regulator